MQTWSFIHPFDISTHLLCPCAFLICIGSSLKESFIDQVKVNFKWPNGQLKLVNSKTLCELIQMSIERREGFLGIFFGWGPFSKLSLDGCIKVVFMKSNKETARFLQDHSRWFCLFITMVLRPGVVVETWLSWSGWKVPSGLPEGIYLSPKPFTEDVYLLVVFKIFIFRGSFPICVLCVWGVVKNHHHIEAVEMMTKILIDIW